MSSIKDRVQETDFIKHVKSVSDLNRLHLQLPAIESIDTGRILKNIEKLSVIGSGLIQAVDMVSLMKNMKHCSKNRMAAAPFARSLRNLARDYTSIMITVVALAEQAVANVFVACFVGIIMLGLDFFAITPSTCWLL